LIGIKLAAAPKPLSPVPQDLFLCARHLFVAAMVVGVHPANQNMTEGQSAFEAVKFSETAKAKRRRHHQHGSN
jgi:hypothetical protein